MDYNTIRYLTGLTLLMLVALAFLTTVYVVAARQPCLPPPARLAAAFGAALFLGGGLVCALAAWLVFRPQT